MAGVGGPGIPVGTHATSAAPRPPVAPALGMLQVRISYRLLNDQSYSVYNIRVAAAGTLIQAVLAVLG